MQNHIEKEFEQIRENFALLKTKAPLIELASEVCIKSLENGGKILFCGNGGSAADAQHLSAELVCKYKQERRAIASIALSTNTSILTAAANDLGFDTIFERQIEAFGKQGDVLLALSTSGNSRNIILALKKARLMGLETILLTGADGGDAKDFANIVIQTPSNITNNIQEMHIAIGHVMCEIIEKSVGRIGER